MPKTLTLSIPHNLTVDEVKSRINNTLARERPRFEQKATVQERWEGNRLLFTASAMGQSVTGHADVTPNSVDISVDLPWMLAMMAGRFRSEIETEGRKLLA